MSTIKCYGFFKTHYTRMVLSQHYVDGIPVFRPEYIGEAIQCHLYTEGNEFLDDMFRRFNSTNAYKFSRSVLSTQSIHYEDIPDYEFIHTGIVGGYFKKPQECCLRGAA